MKFRRGESRVGYLDADGNFFERDEMLLQVQGKTLTEGKEIVSEHEQTIIQEWTDREGKVMARSFGKVVVGAEIKPADADARRADFLRRLREAQAKLTSPDRTPDDVADAMALQIEYMEFMAMLDD